MGTKIRPDYLDRMVFAQTIHIRRQHEEACKRLGLVPRPMTPVQIMQRSVPHD